MTDTDKRIGQPEEGSRTRQETFASTSSSIVDDQAQGRAPEEWIPKPGTKVRAWLEESPVCTKIVDLDLKLRYMSATGCAALGVDDGALYGKPYPFDFYPDVFKNTMTESLVAVKETGKSVTQKGLTNSITGEPLWFQSTLVPVKDAQGNPDHILIVSVDITAQKEAEQALKNALENMEHRVSERTNELHKSEDRFSLAMQGANDGLWDWNLETGEVYYSPRWKSMLGYNEDEFEASLDTWATLVHPDDEARVLQAAQDYIEGRSNSYEVEMRMNHKLGHEVSVLSRAFLTHDEKTRKPLRLVGTHVDITDRKNSEQFILATSHILEMIATGEPGCDIYDAIALLYESRHPGMRCSMLLLENGKLMHAGAPSLPKAYCDAVNGLEYGPSVGSCGTSTFTGCRVLVENIETDPKWAEIKHIALPHGMRCCWSEPIKDSVGETLGAFGMYYNHTALPDETESNDLTSAARLAGIIMERERSQKELDLYKQNMKELVVKRTSELEYAMGEAKKASQAKGSFLANMSHEIRTPMNAIIGLSHLALQTNLSQQQKNYIGNIHQAAESLLGILNDILDFSKIEAGKIELETVEFKPNDVIDRVVNVVAMKARESCVNLSIEIDPALPESLLGDPMRIAQVLINLVDNAIKFSSSGNGISISIFLKEERADQMTLQFSVADTGIGIAPEQKSNLFQAFTQADASTTREFGGTGLGLAVSKEMVKLMGGEIWLESELGLGSTFSFTIRMTKDIADKSKVKKHDKLSERNIDAARAHLRGARVLLVEDNVVNQLVVSELLKSQGVDVVAADNGKEALEALNHQDFDGVLMDCQMPVMDGFEATQKIRRQARFKKLPILALTANAMADDRKKVLDVGMNDHIAKPVQIPDMLLTLAQWISPKAKTSRADANELDQEALQEIRDIQQPGQNSLLVRLIDAYFSSTPPLVKGLDHALEQGDIQIVERNAHTLKSSSATLGLSKFSAMCQQIEEIAQEGDLQRVHDQMPVFGALYERACALLRITLENER